MTINIAGLDEVMARIQLNPGAWVQATYRCSTGMCVAGWRADMSGGEWAYGADDERWFELDCDDDYDGLEARASHLLVAEPGDDMTYVVEGRVVTTAYLRAQRLLGLTDQQADNLFASHNRLTDLHGIVAEFKAQAESEAS